MCRTVSLSKMHTIAHFHVFAVDMHVFITLSLN
uniref:Uncharacterized protein n=1 Tax=Anguilla anguilla TaxID=7936 RepID=A0A0E9S2F3_ANGAN